MAVKGIHFAVFGTRIWPLCWPSVAFAARVSIVAGVITHKVNFTLVTATTKVE